MRTRAAILSTLLAALSGCACDTVPDTAVTDCNAQIIPGGAATDILFVVDDSGSMSDKQIELANNLSSFIDALLGSPVRLDLRIGVTNTSVDNYTGGTMYGAPFGGEPFPGTPGTPYPDGAIVAIEQDPSGIGTAGHFLWGIQYDPSLLTSTWGGPRILSSGPNLARDFKANVHQGDWGSGKEQPLRAMRDGLDAATSPSGVNFGFLRAGARLAVVILSDEDDCSESTSSPTVTSDGQCHGYSPTASGPLDRVADYVQYLDSTVGDRPIVAVIAGFDPAGVPSLCQGATFSATAAPKRLNELLIELDAASPGRTLKASICGSFGTALLGIAGMIIPQTMPLEQAPADYRMLAVAVNRGGTLIPCPLALANSPEASSPTTGVIYTPAQGGAPATLTFQNLCRLAVGDQVELKIVCAR